MNYTFGQVPGNQVVKFFVHNTLFMKVEFYVWKKMTLTNYFIYQVQAYFLQNEHCKSGACTCIPKVL